MYDGGGQGAVAGVVLVPGRAVTAGGNGSWSEGPREWGAPRGQRKPNIQKKTGGGLGMGRPENLSRFKGVQGSLLSK